MAELLFQIPDLGDDLDSTGGWTPVRPSHSDRWVLSPVFQGPSGVLETKMSTPTSTKFLPNNCTVSGLNFSSSIYQMCELGQAFQTFGASFLIWG